MKDLTTFNNIVGAKLDVRQVPGSEDYLLSAVDGYLDKQHRFHGQSVSLIISKEQLLQIAAHCEQEMAVGA